MKSYLLFLIPMLLTTAFQVQAQFRYNLTSTPTYAEVWVNEELRCYTPCDVRFYWREAQNGRIVFSVKHPGYHTWSDSLIKKPRKFFHKEVVVLKRDLPHFEFDTLTAPVAFDKILADGFKDGQSIGSLTMLDGTKEIIKWEGTVKVGEASFEKKFYELIEKTGFQTPAIANTKLFNSDHRSKPVLPRFVVGLKLEDYDVDMRIERRKGSSRNEMVGTTRMNFEWQVLDKRKGEVVLKYKNEGKASLRQQPYMRSPNNLTAFEGALLDFLENSEFFELVNSSRPGVIEPTPDMEHSFESEYHIPRLQNPQFAKMSEMIQYANKSCVTIVTDGGHGSGVIIDESGLLISAYHVVEGVNRIEVKFSEGLTLNAKVLAFNANQDIVLLKIDGSGFRALPVNTRDISIGDDVVTIGTPHDLRLGQSVARGMISGKRSNEDEIVLQADINVSPGNSGGPLINESGEVVGIVQSKIIKSGVEGIGFALPIKTALELLKIEVSE